MDDAVVVRRLLSTVIDEDPQLHVAGTAANGRIALAKIEQLKPDIVTLDIEMPELDGIATLKEIRKSNKSLPVIMFSTLTARGAAATFEALSLGASDYVTKPANVGSVGAAMESVRRELIPRIKALCTRLEPVTAPPLPRPVRIAPASGRVDLVVIGSSTGGPNALNSLLSSLPADLPVPVLVAQHMPPLFTGFLARRLDGISPLAVREAESGDMLRPGGVWIAPGDYHLVVRQGTKGLMVTTNQDEPENFCRPSVDVLLRSAASAMGGNVLAIVLTGMGHDGRDGCAVLKERGAQVIVQDQATSVVWGMPGAVVAAGLADDVLPIGAIAGAIVARVAAGRLVLGTSRS
ncbi:MAG: chemotaxis response regulator protein-glutamate methylesterase [Acidimicrobiia bacterium]